MLDIKFEFRMIQSIMIISRNKIAFFFFGHATGMQDLSSPPGIEPVPLAVEVQSLNPWMAREVLDLSCIWTLTPISIIFITVLNSHCSSIHQLSLFSKPIQIFLWKNRLLPILFIFMILIVLNSCQSPWINPQWHYSVTIILSLCWKFGLEICI